MRRRGLRLIFYLNWNFDMSEEIEPQIKFDWNFAEFFWPEYLHDLYKVGGPFGSSLIQLMHELSELTNYLIG